MAQKKQISIWVINIFIAITIFVLLGTAYLTFSSATITIPKTREQFKTNTAVAVSAAPGDDAILGDVIVREYIKSMTVAVGSSTSKSAKAGGTVTITNKTTRNQPLVATTRLLTPDNKLYRIQKGVTAPAGGTVTVFAEADTAGDEFLIGPSKFTIPGLSVSLQASIYAESTADMTHERFSSGIVTGDLLSKTETDISTALLKTAADEIRASLPAGFIFLEPSLETETIKRSSQPSEGATADSVTVTATISVTALAVNESQLNSAAEAALRRELPETQRLIEVIPGSLTLKVNSIDVGKKTAEVSAEIAAWISSDSFDSTIDLKQLAGKNKKAAAAYLSSQGFDTAEILVKPGFLPTLPLLTDHINVRSK